ncbi:hypothetical protein [Thermogymnomonas acidicola]|uniref:hypothetical protein n=1 Tax=Thermogymnomonas acidicola TaxID=399579 RepID=UPI0009465846|nr:hypothetical protein [Thermogymnomonas acidicola]
MAFAWLDYDGDMTVTLFFRQKEEERSSVERLSEVLSVEAVARRTPPLSLMPPDLSGSYLSRVDLRILEHICRIPGYR